MQKFITSTALVTAFVAVFATPALAQSSQAAPSLKILTPGPAQTIYGNTVPVLISVENLELTDYQTSALPQLGQGHIHLWLDDDTLTNESAIKVTTDTHTFSGVTPGDHTLVAEIVNNNHTSLIPAQITTVKFTVAPAATPSSTASGFDKNTAFVILVVVALIIIAAWWYTKEEDEEVEVANKKRQATSRKTARKRRR
ncbi:hypothetical protein HYW40_00460 [Candidatus Curtissbacteria bacterium]|nr:hypothetical protein [Candidatus Curtissbacteria bacterium]